MTVRTNFLSSFHKYFITLQYYHDMLSKVRSATLIGIQGFGVIVEVDYSRKSFPTFKIVGLPHQSVAEARERVRSALKNAQFKIPSARITVNLAPADIPKRGSLFDLPIAVGLLVSAGVISPSAIENRIFIGELSLDGGISPIPGVVPITLYAKRAGMQSIYIPYGNQGEVSTIDDFTVVPVRTLSEVVSHLRNAQAPCDRQLTSWSDTLDEATSVTIPIQGQLEARRALEISIAGGHHLYMKGPPGVGKTLIAQTAPYLLPPMNVDEYYDVLVIRSVQSESPGEHIARPFRAPHSAITRRYLIGGGTYLSPGEVTYAHNGVLFLDEFPLFNRTVIDALRKPLDDGFVDMSHPRGIVRMPAKFLLVATGNICPCGYLGHPTKSCTCTQQSISAYNRKLSGPIMERIDLHVKLYDVPQAEIAQMQTYSIQAVQQRIRHARERQRARFEENTQMLNAHIPHKDIEKYCPLTEQAKKLLLDGYKKLRFSARSYFKTIKIARTIADIEGKDPIDERHIAEAMYYRE